MVGHLDLLKIAPREAALQGLIAAMATEPPDPDASTLAAARAYFDGSALPFLEDVRPTPP